MKTGIGKLAIGLYSEFCDDVYCAGFVNGVQTDEDLQKEFSEWLANNYGQEVDNFRDYELAGLPVLHEIVVEHFDRLIKLGPKAT